MIRQSRCLPRGGTCRGTSCSSLLLRTYATSSRPPIIQFSNATFYRQHPSSVHTSKTPNNPLFPNLNFSLPSFSSTPEHWSIIGPSSSGKTTFLQLLRGSHLSIPPTARSYPYLNSEEIDRKDHALRNPSTAIKYVGFGGEGEGANQAIRGAYLSARYESRREITDFSVLNYLQGRTELNAVEDKDHAVDRAELERVIKDLRLGELVDMPVANLSNGQTRRAKIAKALLGKPEVLLLDEPFMGLDPPTLMTLSPLLHGLAKANNPRLVLALRPQDPIPDWITHLLYLKPECEVAFAGEKEKVLDELRAVAQGKDKVAHMPMLAIEEIGRELSSTGIKESSLAKASTEQADESSSTSREGESLHDSSSKDPSTNEALVEMSGVRVTYGSKTVLGNWTQDVDGSRKDGLWWNVRRGERWGVFGPNGSGKTTILSLICSDHPQTYSLPILLFGRSRLPEMGKPGISVFDIQSRMGQSSPEIHHYMPRSSTLRQTLESAWADTFQSRPKLDNAARAAVEATLRWFEPELRPGAIGGFRQQEDLDKDNSTKWADEYLFGGLPFSTQRLALFLRALIKKPELVILDEAFSGMDDKVRDKCMLFLAHGETKTYSYDAPSSTSEPSTTAAPAQPKRIVVDSEVAKQGNIKVTGLEERQALLCISHVREEIPGCVREWICLPEANTGKPARFGRLEGPIEGDWRRWGEIWGM